MKASPHPKPGKLNLNQRSIDHHFSSKWIESDTSTPDYEPPLSESKDSVSKMAIGPDEAESEAPDARRTQLGALRDEVTKLEKTVVDINSRLKALVDGRRPEPSKELVAETKIEAAPIPSVTERIKSMRNRLENTALERLRRIGTD